MKAVLLLFALLLAGHYCKAQTQAQAAVEKKHLETARKNIEIYRKGNAHITITDANGKPVKNAIVEIDQTTQDFLFGNLIEDLFEGKLTPAQTELFKTRFTALFNFTELNIKWGKYEPQQGKPEWQKLQQKLDWCANNGITPKGHALGWTNLSGTPRWLLKLPKERAGNLYSSRIYNLVGGFKDQIKMWDVVNEPVTTVTWEMALRDSALKESQIAEGSRYQVAGITTPQILPWVEKSFNNAQEADPNGDFILNEFYLIAKPEVREKFFQLVKAMLKDKVPVRGIGIQAHEPRDMWFSPSQIQTTFDSLATLGLPLHITEFIPQSSQKPITGIWRKGIWTEEAQAEFAEQFYTLAFGHPAIASIHWWGLSDGAIWLPGGGLLDKDLNPKPVYTRLLKLIKTDWMTKNIRLKTDKDGKANFRGFYGNYQIKSTGPNGKENTYKVHLAQNTLNDYQLKTQ